MTKTKKGIELLDQIRQSKNVRTACQKLGISRSQYYKLLQNPEWAVPKTYEPSKMGKEIHEKIIETALVFPFGCHSMSYRLMEEGMVISPVSIQKVLKSHQLGTASERFKALENKILNHKKFSLNEDQKEFLASYNPALLEHHRRVKKAGDLLTVFAYFLGQLPWLGKVYLYFCLDAYSGYIQVMLCYSPDKYLCAEFLKETILPFYETQGIVVQQVETSDDPEFFSYAQHPFSSFLRSLSYLKYKRTTIGGLKTNGYSQKWGHYLKKEIVPAIKQRKAKYLDLEQLNEDLQVMLGVYNTGQSEAAKAHLQSYPFHNRIPADTLTESKKTYS